MTAPLVILQARTSSRRLPGKVLMDFHGLPLAVLAARRAASRGARVVLATSLEASDDALAETAHAHGLPVVRGPLDDVLGRFILALGDAPDAAPVVRLTADNVLPDGALIAEVVAELDARQSQYLTTTADGSGLPYGCSVEVTRAGHLRAAHAAASTAHEREHVTPWVRERFGVQVFDRYAGLGMEDVRATIDTPEDFALMHASVPDGADLKTLGWLEWARHLSRCVPGSMTGGVRQLVVGTAQMGMAYGIARASSPGEDAAVAMLERAVSAGVAWLDTARAYGRSEAVVGRFLSGATAQRVRVVTKLSPLSELAADAGADQAAAAARDSLMRSAGALSQESMGQERLDAVLLHRCAHLTSHDGAIWRCLVEWRDEGRIGALGVSVQSPQELAMALGFADVTHIQMPWNVLDHRWERVLPDLEAARLERGVIVHVRSALLQGLLTSRDRALWARAHVADPAPVLAWLEQGRALSGAPDVAAFCLDVARAQPWVDGVVVGMDDMAQLEANLALFARPAQRASWHAELMAQRPVLDPASLDPARWRTSLE
ncbi:MAG: aldo/keto reductase [Brevundimonas sp.]|uniref:aldo/keto reductase n=1 Tax=Brevundimonas sp. TaxID=1871086 RepID=UPI00391D8DF2